MLYRKFGKTNLDVSVVGLGCAALGGVYGDLPEAEAIATVHAALDDGINFLDTAPLYALTRSEAVVGKALRGVSRERYYISSKVGRYGIDDFDFSYGRVMAGLDASLQRLGCGHLDIAVLHDVEFVPMDQVINEGLRALHDARQQGKIRFIAASGLPLSIFPAILSRAELDAVITYGQYTLQNTAAASMLPLFEQHQLGIVNASPLGLGLLTPQGPRDWHLGSEKLKQTCRLAAEWCADHAIDIAELGMRFALANPRFHVTLTGVRSPAEIQHNIRSVSHPPDPDAVRTVQKILEPVFNEIWPSGRPEYNGAGLPSPIDNYIAPDNLLGLVRNTAPFLEPSIQSQTRLAAPRLIELGASPLGHLEVLANGADLASRDLSDVEMNEDYFAFCLACHHATVATFVPTDVDAKIRGLLWRHRDKESLRRMFEFTLRALNWSIDGISTRATELARVGPVSGHNGEQLSVLAGALGAFLNSGDMEYIELASDAIDAELQREATEFRFALAHKGCELDALRLSATLTHNVGDLDQGISFWKATASHDVSRQRFGRLAHENTSPYDGAFQHAARIYKKAMACEGHRHYPLRQVKSLRQSPDLLLPLGPFLDDWGAMTAVHSSLTLHDRADVLAALIHGCRTIAGQRGYYRALRGMIDALGGNFERVIQLTANRTRAEWKDAEIRKQIAVPRVSFESMMKKML